MHDPHERAGPVLMIHLDGEFDPAAARSVRERVIEAGCTVVLDVHGARHIDPAGLTWLARELPSRGRLVVRGLSREHLRILRYLGVDPSLLGVAEAGEPEDDADV